jgi:hypothetical protein
LDVLIGFSGLLAAASLLWILLALLGALVAGALVASLFGVIFYSLSRLARALSGPEAEPQAGSNGL